MRKLPNIVNFDPYSVSLWEKNDDMGRDIIERIMQNIVDNGGNTVFWRVSCIGKVMYWSKIEYIHDGGLPMAGKKIGRLMKKYDLTQLAVEYARKYGLKIYIWMTLYDDFYPGMSSKLVEKHPECQWVDRSGDIYFKGVFNYCYPEVREHKLGMIKELVCYNADGFFLSVRSHAPHNNPYDQEDMFGYNEPIVKEYKSRYGVDITQYDDVNISRHPKKQIAAMEYTGNDFDRELWHRLKGEYHTLFIKSASEIVKRHKQELIVHVAGDYNGIYPLGRTNRNSARFYADYTSWVRNRIVDGLVLIPPVNSFEVNTREMGTSGWGYEEYNYDHEYEYIKYFREKVKDNTKLYMWHHVNVKYKGWDNLKLLSGQLLSHGQGSLIDGLIFHEAGTFQYGLR